MIVDRAWAERNLGFDPSAKARPCQPGRRSDPQIRWLRLL